MMADQQDTNTNRSDVPASKKLKLDLELDDGMMYTCTVHPWLEQRNYGFRRLGILDYLNTKVLDAYITSCLCTLLTV